MAPQETGDDDREQRYDNTEQRDENRHLSRRYPRAWFTLPLERPVVRGG